MNDQPAITVIIPVWNSMPYVIRTVEAILNQTFTDFELLIVDDKGGDHSIESLAPYVAKDSRIRILDNGVNRGFSGAMNHGLEQARGEFIAAMDADDIALPHRLQSQIDYLRQHPDVAMVGSAAYVIDSENNLIAPHRQPKEDITIRFQQLLMPAFYHPSTMMRTSVVAQHQLRYNSAIPLADDFDFWSQLGKHGKLHNVPDVLVYYRVHSASLSTSKKEECNTRKISVIEHSLRALGMEQREIDSVTQVLPLLYNEDPVPAEKLESIWSALTQTLAAFCVKEQLPQVPWILKASIAKWMVKTILYTPSTGYRLRALFTLALQHPVYTLMGAAHIAELILWQQRTILKFRSKKI